MLDPKSGNTSGWHGVFSEMKITSSVRTYSPTWRVRCATWGLAESIILKGQFQGNKRRVHGPNQIWTNELGVLVHWGWAAQPLPARDWEMYPPQSVTENPRCWMRSLFKKDASSNSLNAEAIKISGIFAQMRILINLILLFKTAIRFSDF